MLRGVHHPARYRTLARIRALDPERDTDEIVRLTSRLEFPWDYTQGTALAFLRDYGVPTIARVLAATREFEDHGVKRYDDTILIGDEASLEGIDSPRAHAAIRRLNRIHGHYAIPNDEFAYVLATTLVGPVEWIRAYGWRELDPHELVALARFTTRFGELMGIKGLPTTYDGYLALLRDYEARRFAPTPEARRLAEASLRIARQVAAPAPLRPLVRPMTIALMDEPLRAALGMPRPPRLLAAAVRRGLRLRGRVLRLAPPRRVPYRHRPSTYPQGYRLGDLGPASMLEDLARPEHPHRPTGATA
jgi:hypothetical protein